MGKNTPNRQKTKRKQMTLINKKKEFNEQKKIMGNK